MARVIHQIGFRHPWAVLTTSHTHTCDGYANSLTYADIRSPKHMPQNAHALLVSIPLPSHVHCFPVTSPAWSSAARGCHPNPISFNRRGPSQSSSRRYSCRATTRGHALPSILTTRGITQPSYMRDAGFRNRQSSS
jgi:hypothetical protein